MYKFKSYLMALLAAGSVAFMTSCGDNTTDPDPKPTLDFAGGTGYTAGDVTVVGGEDLTVKVIAKSNSSGRNLKNFKITQSGQPVALKDTALTGENFDYVYHITAPVAAGDVTYTFSVTDRDGNVASKTIKVTTPALQSYTAVIMGAVNNANGSFFSTQNGIVYKIADAKANSGKVDFLYYHQVSGTLAADMATIAAPSDPAAATIFNSTTNGVQTWATKNPTKFKMGDIADFTGANNGKDLADMYANSTETEMSKMTQLVAGDVFLFMTAGGKHGVAKVLDVVMTPTPDAGSIKLDVKVQG